MMAHQIIKRYSVLLIFLTLILGNAGFVFSQSLEDLLDAETKPETNYATATFKATRIINGHSIERMQKKELDFRISHRFGRVNEGAYEFFGLDYSLIHLSLEYGVADWLMLGFGRANFEKTFDGFAKFSILRQSNGARKMPIHLSYLASTELSTLKWVDESRDNIFANRLTFVHQLMIARKFSKSFSFQLTPTLIHINLVPMALESNDLYAMGAGFRYKLSNRVSLNGEYFYVYRKNGQFLDTQYYDPIAIGVDIETGGHVFQIMLTNSRAMREGGFIGRTTGNWLDGDIHIGFNVSRVFSL